MPENPKEWPRVRTCLYDWCPHEREDCKQCDAVLAIRRKIQYPQDEPSEVTIRREREQWTNNQ